jgi:hypothetical protein
MNQVQTITDLNRHDDDVRNSNYYLNTEQKIK